MLNIFHTLYNEDTKLHPCKKGKLTSDSIWILLYMPPQEDELAGSIPPHDHIKYVQSGNPHPCQSHVRMAQTDVSLASLGTTSLHYVPEEQGTASCK